MPICEKKTTPKQRMQEEIKTNSANYSIKKIFRL